MGACLGPSGPILRTTGLGPVGGGRAGGDEVTACRLGQRGALNTRAKTLDLFLPATGAQKQALEAAARGISGVQKNPRGLPRLSGGRWLSNVAALGNGDLSFSKNANVINALAAKTLLHAVEVSLATPVASGGWSSDSGLL